MMAEGLCMGAEETKGAEQHERAPWIGRPAAGRSLAEREIGEGGLGVVFQARDARLDKRVALKILAKEVAADPDSLARFKQEATAAARIGHKGIVDVTDFDQDEQGTHFMVMELIDG